MNFVQPDAPPADFFRKPMIFDGRRQTVNKEQEQ